LQERRRQRELGHPREAASQRHEAHVVVIQVDEADPIVAKRVAEARGRQQVFDIAAMARPFADRDASGAGATAGDRRPGDDERMGVDRGARFVLDHIRLEEHAAAGQIDLQLAQPTADQVGEVRGVCGGGQERDGGSLRQRKCPRVVRRRSARAGDQGNGQAGQELAARHAQRVARFSGLYGHSVKAFGAASIEDSA
jgi:hypothetical protein